MTRDDFESMCSGRDAFCDFCQANECEKCEKCIITKLLDDAYNELSEEVKAEFKGRA